MPSRDNQQKHKRFPHIIAGILAWVAGVTLMLTVVLEIILSSSIATGIVNRYAARFIDGNASFGTVSASVLRDFPSVNVTFRDFCISYPSDRFDDSENSGPKGHLTYAGCGEISDTLAAFDRFSISLRPSGLLFGRINITQTHIEKPRIFAHAYADGKANWNIFRSNADDEKTDSDTDSSPSGKMPVINIGHIRITDRPTIVYTDSRDTIFAMINLKEAGFNGRLTTGKTSRNRIGLTLDSMFVAGRISRDTLALGLDRLHIHEHHRHMDIDMQAKTLAATRSFGRLSVPIDITATVSFPKDSVPAVSISTLKADIAAIPITGEAQLRFHGDCTDIAGDLHISSCKVSDIKNRFIRNFIPEADRISTDALITLDLSCKDTFIHNSGKLPAFRARLSIPESSVRHSDFPHEVRLAFDAAASSASGGRVDINISDAMVRTTGLDIHCKGGMNDIMSDDPLVQVDGRISAVLDSLSTFIPDSLQITARGNLDAEIKGNARLSHLSLYTFSQSELSGHAESEEIIFRTPDDSIDVNISGLHLDLGPEQMTSKRDTNRTFRLMGISGNLKKADLTFTDAFEIRCEGVGFSAKNSAENPEDSTLNRLGGRFTAERFNFTDASGTNINLDLTRNSFQMMPKPDNPKIPVLSLTSINKRITLATDINRAILTDASVRASAAMNSIERRERVRKLRDSLAKAFPEIPRDSLLLHMASQRQRQEIPQWLKEEDFRKQDIDIHLDQSLARYFRDWDINGNIDVRTGIIMTPYFPLRNILRGMELEFNNDKIALDSLKVMSGKSAIEAKGELTGLRRALAGRAGSRSSLRLKLDIGTDGMDANEILTAYNTGSHFNPEISADKLADASNADFLKMVTTDTSAVKEESKLIVIPGNLDAEINMKGKDIRYTDLQISDIGAHLLMKERCVQITNTMAASNVGNVSFEGFYATRSKQDIKAGFNFGFSDITAEKAIGLMPAVDTIMPLLKSFAGNLDCELAATASLDTNMNILTPTINGIIRISGNDLTISDNDMFTSLAKKLKFDNRKTGRINHMTVEGVIKDNVLEVFPFVISLDRYSLALSGKQNMDMSYRYHASLIRSPLLIKVGVDVYGTDFDHMKFKIGRPKYRNEKVPVFSAVIDETKINLAESIKGIFEKGVDAAVEENARQQAIERHMNEIGYVNAVDMQTEELSEEEQKELDEAASDDRHEETTDNQENNEQSGVY